MATRPIDDRRTIVKLQKLVAALAVAAIASATITPALEAQTPKPPTDARRTVQPAKRGKLVFGVAGSQQG